MDDLPKILQNLPRIIEQPQIPAGVQQALAAATAGLKSVKETVARQKELLERGFQIEREYERSVELYEKLHNQAEDIGGPNHSQ